MRTISESLNVLLVPTKARLSTGMDSPSTNSPDGVKRDGRPEIPVIQREQNHGVEGCNKLHYFLLFYAYYYSPCLSIL
jgi:hypothetical protein